MTANKGNIVPEHAAWTQCGASGDWLAGVSFSDSVYDHRSSFDLAISRFSQGFGPMIFRRILILLAGLATCGGAVLLAQEPSAPAAPATPTTWDQGWEWTKQVLQLRLGDNEIGRVLASLCILIAAVMLRRVVITIIFRLLKRLASRTETTLDDKLFVGLQGPLSTFVLIVGVFMALTLLKLDPQMDQVLLWTFQVTIMTVVFWGFLRVADILADHLHEHAKERNLGITPFVPIIKKTLRVFFIIIGIILIIQNMGYSVSSLLAGLGIGGLAVALAAQDSLSNFFGSLVVAIDQPFKIGDFVKIGEVTGSVEEIGLRSTRIRTPQRTVTTIPNKMMATDAINNFTAMPQRRVDQTIGLTYDTTPEQMDAILADIRGILRNDPGVHQDLVVVNFTNYGAYSLDIQIIFFALDPAFVKAIELRERINLAIMRAVNARGLSFAFPTQTLHFDGEIARKLADRN